MPAPTHHQPLKCLLEPVLVLEPDLPWPRFSHSLPATVPVLALCPIRILFFLPKKKVSLLCGVIYIDWTGCRISIHRFSRHVDFISCTNVVANADLRHVHNTLIAASMSTHNSIAKSNAHPS